MMLQLLKMTLGLFLKMEHYQLVMVLMRIYQDLMMQPANIQEMFFKQVQVHM